MKSNQQSENNKGRDIRLIALAIIVVTGFLIAMLLINPLRLITSEAPVSDEMKTFRLDQDRIEFVYPGNWHAYPTPQGNHGDLESIAFVTAPVPIFQNITIARKTLHTDDVSVVADWGELRIKSRFAQYKLGSTSLYTSVYTSGLIREYTGNSGSPIDTQNVHCKDFYFLHEDNGYAFSFCADESDWNEVAPIFNAIADSIHIMN